MAFSQKHVGKCVVPWFCNSEWQMVSDFICKNSNNKKQFLQKALDIINIWKARTVNLPCGVEGTFNILNAILLDRDLINSYNLRVSASLSLLRFLNLCAAYSKNQMNFYATARAMKLPKYLVDLRHVVAHGNNLPRLDVLDKALNYCLDWLCREYWQHEKNKLNDFIDDSLMNCDKLDRLKCNLQPIVSNYCYVTLFTHPHWNLQYINDLENELSISMFIREIESVTNESINPDMELKHVLHYLWNRISCYLDLSFDDTCLVFAECLLEDIFLGDFKQKDKIFANADDLPSHFKLIWQHLFKNISTNMLDAVIVKLVEKTQSQNIHTCTKTIAAKWILEICKALDLREFKKRTIISIKRKKTKLKFEFIQKYKNAIKQKYGKHNILKLDKSVEVPSCITDLIKFKKIFFSEPNEFIHIYIKQLIDLNDMLKIPDNQNLIMKFINCYKNYQNETKFDDCLVSKGIAELLKTENVSDEDNDNQDVDMNEHPVWRRIEEINFGNCALGILPWQSTDNNPFL